MSVRDVYEGVGEVLKGLDSVVVGYRREKEILVASLLADGHVLLEGVPGIAKTTMVKALARLMNLNPNEWLEFDGLRYKGFSRIQFTPDLLPGDVTGSLIFNPRDRRFEPHFGPVFTFLLLADEINRAVPRTQSALLEAMQERQVTIGDTTYPLEIRDKGKWFLVVATQNPVEQEGTYPLPEAQLDRFMARILFSYPETLEEEKNILRLHSSGLVEPVTRLEPVVEPSWLIGAQEAVASHPVPDGVIDYITRLVRATRPEIYKPAARYFTLGASPRAGIALLRASRALSVIRGEDAVSIESVKDMVFHILNHRLIPNNDTLVEYEEEHGIYHAKIELIRDGISYIIENLP
ncbi:MAG: AAA family ATPase [Desulfurococcales archaeon]|nr:AAA family ATPase [Desulfurococcales archaeon]